MIYTIKGGERIKSFNSPNYNYLFNMDTGYFVRWGEKMCDDPQWSKFGPEILDIEISTICSNGCKFCYKTNTDKGINMSLKTFKKIFKIFPETLTQIAFGIGDIEANKDLWAIMGHCRENDIIPNITINGKRMTDEYYDLLAKYCGAVAVSLYEYDICYNAVQELTRRQMKQINIHCLLSDETHDKCLQVLKDVRSDHRLAKLNAVVFLSLKPKGDRNTFHCVKEKKKYDDIVNYAFDNNIAIGFDSCSAANFNTVMKLKENYAAIKDCIEPCESTLFSYYINAKGKGFPCSFSENIPYKGIDLTKTNNFLEDVWNGLETISFRSKVLDNRDCNDCRMCPLYDLEVKE